MPGPSREPRPADGGPDAAQGAGTRWRWLPAARARTWLLAQASTPGVRLLFAPPVALALALLAALPAWRRIDQPLVDLVTASLGHEALRGDVFLVAVEDWVDPVLDPASGSDAAAVARGALREQVAAGLTRLGRRAGSVIALDVLLESATTPAADRALAEAVAGARAAGASVLVAVDRAVPLDRAFRDLAPPGSVTQPVDGDGVTRWYGLPGEIEQSLAALAARALDAAVPLPAEPFLLAAIDGRALDRRTMPLERLLAAPELLEALPSPALFVIGSGSRARPARDRHIVVAPDGYAVVPGMSLHAAAASSLLERSAVTRAGPLLQGSILLAALAANLAALALVAAALRRAGRRLTPLLTLTLALLFGLAALPAALLLAAHLGTMVSPLALAAAPLFLVALGHALSHGFRRAYLQAAVRPPAGAPAPLVRSLSEAFTEADPFTRLARTVTAYEDLLHHLVVCRLASDPLPSRVAAELRELWHTQQTLPAVAAALRVLDPALGERVAALGWLEGSPHARALLESAYRIRGAAPSVRGREKYRNAFILVRNALAHESQAWMDADTVARIAVALQDQLRALHRLPEVRRLLAEHRLGFRPASDGGLLAVLEPLARPAGDASGTGSAGGTGAVLAPWLIAEHPDAPGAPPRLFRYRGLADRADWPRRDGVAHKLVVYSEFGASRHGLPERRLVALAEVLPAMPEALRIPATA